MKCQRLFSGKNKKNIKMPSADLFFLPRMLSVKMTEYLWLFRIITVSYHCIHPGLFIMAKTVASVVVPEIAGRTHS